MIDNEPSCEEKEFLHDLIAMDRIVSQTPNFDFCSVASKDRNESVMLIRFLSSLLPFVSMWIFIRTTLNSQFKRVSPTSSQLFIVPSLLYGYAGS